ncbi:MAG: hypothetical protein BVN34_09075 [Proteobacteria bacterium ST_bin12]|nr:MAG: hypothetical protein BVN34_09075 [Proteobacteria bacterium ST_bin12]
MKRFNRNIIFFGVDGQRILRESVVAVVGCGGLGHHVIQQLAYLGVKKIIAIDDEVLSLTNKNRYVLAYDDDPITGFHKVDLIKRSVYMIDPSIEVETVHASLRSAKAIVALKQADVIFGCLDDDGPRFILNEFALAYDKELFDLASDTDNEGMLIYGGRMVYVRPDEPGCLVCMDVLNMNVVTKFLSSENGRRDREDLYGVDKTQLEEGGPSVVSLNGIIASLAVMEYMLQATGIRKAKKKLEYRGNMGIVAVKNEINIDDCHYCKNVRGVADATNLERYL